MRTRSRNWERSPCRSWSLTYAVHTLAVSMRGADCLHSSYCLSKHWFRLGDGLWPNIGTRTTSRKCCASCPPTIAHRRFLACSSAPTPKTPTATLSRWDSLFNADLLLWKHSLFALFFVVFLLTRYNSQSLIISCFRFFLLTVFTVSK